mmetsp:Transcript_134920/g.269215  ORF Transcript_134920/g.269215 Transcript_134920/m.269215 type:complete len:336 (-) Transcript_134920:122-1129(-)
MVAETPENRQIARCLFTSAVEVVRSGLKGSIVVASCDIPQHTIVLVEGALSPHELPPPYLHPTSSSRIPFLVAGIPVCLIPVRAVMPLQLTMSYLRYKLNAFQRLYCIGSAFSHSCAPNAHRMTFDDGLSVVISNSPIQAGEEVTLAYTNFAATPYLPAIFRRLHLLCKFGFWCQCGRCTGHASSISRLLHFHWHSDWDETAVKEMAMALIGSQQYGKVTDQDERINKARYLAVHVAFMVPVYSVLGILMVTLTSWTYMLGLWRPAVILYMVHALIPRILGLVHMLRCICDSELETLPDKVPVQGRTWNGLSGIACLVGKRSIEKNAHIRLIREG